MYIHVDEFCFGFAYICVCGTKLVAECWCCDWGRSLILFCFDFVVIIVAVKWFLKSCCFVVKQAHNPSPLFWNNNNNVTCTHTYTLVCTYCESDLNKTYDFWFVLFLFCICDFYVYESKWRCVCVSLYTNIAASAGCVALCENDETLSLSSSLLPLPSSSYGYMQLTKQLACSLFY